MSSQRPVSEWRKAPRWTVSHHIAVVERSPFNGVVWGRTSCGRDVSWNKLEPEPTGVDTVNRCERCRTKVGGDQ